MSLSSVAVVLVVLCLSGCTFGDKAEDQEVEKASMTILNAAGDFIDGQSVKITDVTLQGAHGETGRGSKKLMRMAIPLIVGFKIAGIIVAAMTALKVLVLKTVVMSGIAILASLALAAKQLYDKIKEKKALQSHEGFHSTPYFYPGMAATADMSWDPSNAGYEIHGLGAAASQDLSHLGTDFQASYAAGPLSGAGAAATALGNGTSFGFVPGTHYIPVAERKSHVRQPMYRTTLYKTVVKEA